MEDAEDLDDDTAWTHRPTAEDLKSRWLQNCRAVKALERAEWGTCEPSSALAAARNARDDAERRWREMLAPKPVSVRMGYAQKKYDRAQRAVDKAYQELQDFEEEAERRRGELQEAVERAESRRDVRQEELDALHQEAGDLAAQRNKCDSDVGYKVRELVAKELQAFVESLEEGSDARGRAKLLLARVATAVERDEHQQYCIHTDGEDACGDDGGAYQVVARRARASQRSQAGQETRRAVAWNTNAQGRWNRHNVAAVGGGFNELAETAAPCAGSERGRGDQAAGSCDIKPNGHEATSAPTPTSTTATGGKGKKNAREHDDAAPQPPSGKSHRGEDEVVEVSVDAAGDDAARAAKLKQEQDAAIAAAREAGATFGDEASMQIAGQLYAHKVQLVADRARAAGVEPSSNGKPLIGLSPHDLNKWVQDVLAPAEAEAMEGKDL